MVLIKDIIVSIISAFWGIIQYFIDKTVEAGVAPDPLVVIAIVVILTVWMASGAFAGTIAGMRERSIILHGFIGMLLPYIWPIVLVFALDVKGAKGRAKTRVKEEEAKLADEEEQRRMQGLTDTASDEDDDIEEERSQFNSEYFSRIARDENGEMSGPWAITFGGNEIIADHIVEHLDEVVVVEVRSSEEEMSRIRIPYSRITSCEPG